MIKSSFLRFLAIPLIWAGSIAAMSITQEDIQRQFIEAIKKNRLADTAFFLDQGALIEEPDLEGKAALDYLAQLHEHGQELRDLLQERYPDIDIPEQTQAPEPSEQAAEPAKVDRVQIASLRSNFLTRIIQSGHLTQPGTSAAQDLRAPLTTSESKRDPFSDLISAVAPHSLTHLFLEHPQLFQRCTASLQRDVGRTIAQKILHESPIKRFLREKIKSSNYCLCTLKDNGKPQFNPNDGTLLTVNKNGEARLWDATKGRCLRVFKGDLIENAFFNHAGNKIITTSGRAVTILTAPHGVPLQGISGSVPFGEQNNVCFNATGQRMALQQSSPPNSFELVDLPSGKCLITTNGAAAGAQGLMNAAGDRSLSLDKGIVYLSDVDTGACVHTFRNYESGKDAMFRFVDDEDKFYTYDENGDIKEWQNADSESPDYQHGKHITRIKYAAFCAQDTRIITRSHHGTVKMWDILSGECVYELSEKIGLVLMGSASRFVTVDADGLLQMRDVLSGECVKKLPGNYIGVTAVKFSPAGDKCIILNGSVGVAIQVWDVLTGNCLLTINDAPVSGAEFDQTETFVLSSELDEAKAAADIKIWHIRSGELIYATRVHCSADQKLERVTSSGMCLQSSAQGDKIAVSLNAVIAAGYYGEEEKISSTHVIDSGRLVKLLQWLDNECSFEQAVLLTCIYENLVALSLLEKRCPTIPYWRQLWKRRFDFNKCPHLQAYFDTMPLEVRAILENYVIKSGQQ